ncbi:antitoxin Xre/MbcA/ParS toxin-binding domain-containing protein [Microvirga sp. BSC39]|uniref:antitoxin Xre/MbcA/ParS toxin-binding domain-containing protein n=1 Tax=Microvirga sp. BSC39 TaxID=1549810 RepID=UPI00056D6EA5|nr:antitoxin Xre/MbcA/ParS toxin-binding domain-containing protein [Microvirga sp. BSC39]
MSFEFWFATVILPGIVCCMAWAAVLLNEWHYKRQRARARSGELHQPLGPEDAVLVSKATLRAAAHLSLPDPVLATILGLSASGVEQGRESQTPVIQDWLTLERAAPVIRLSRALNQDLGGDAEAVESWVRSHNTAFDERPIDILQTAGGPQRVLDHVQALLGSSCSV